MEDLGGWLGHLIPDADTTEIFYASADPNYLLSARVALEAVFDEIASHASKCDLGAPNRPGVLSNCSQGQSGQGDVLHGRRGGKRLIFQQNQSVL